MKVVLKIFFLFLFILAGRLSLAAEAQSPLTLAASEFKAPSAPTSDHTNQGQFFPEDLVQGSREAKVVVIEYFSPTCPHCAFFHKEVYPKLKEKYINSGKIAYVQREFIGTPQDMNASILARCAGPMKRLVFYDVLLAQQESWAFNRNYNEILVNIGQMGGVSPEQYKKCLEDKELGIALMNNTKLIARTPGFVGTPVFVINNKLYNGKFSFEELSRTIEAINLQEGGN